MRTPCSSSTEPLCGHAVQRPWRSAVSNRGSEATEVIIRCNAWLDSLAAAFLLPDFRLHDDRHHTLVAARGWNVVNQGQEILEAVLGLGRAETRSSRDARFRGSAERAAIPQVPSS